MILQEISFFFQILSTASRLISIMALAFETYNGDIMAFKKFQQNVLDDLQAQGKGWTVNRPGQVNHKSLEVIPEPLGDQIDGDDGQQIITPTSTRMRHDENIRKLLA